MPCIIASFSLVWTIMSFRFWIEAVKCHLQMHFQPLGFSSLKDELNNNILHEACNPWASSAALCAYVDVPKAMHAVGPTQKIAVNLDVNPPVW
ncbi:hypothetical protein V8C37DRAFT_201968 [Trichoderma ceciliae]